MSVFLIGFGVVLLLLSLGLAFTVYGAISAGVGLACLVTGVVPTARAHPPGNP